MVATTETATDKLRMILDKLATQPNMSNTEAVVLVETARRLLKNRCLIREDLNGALAVNLATLDFPLQISKDGPTEKDCQLYHDFVGMCRETA